jgi:hypothetical protein
MLVKNSDVVVDSGSSAKHEPAQILAAIIHSESFLRPYFIPGDLGPFSKCTGQLSLIQNTSPCRRGGREKLNGVET